MKRFMFLIGLILISTNAYAGHAFDVNNYFSSTYNYDQRKNEFGTKLDAPYLVEVHKDWFVGVEGGKDLYSTSMSEGWFSYAKITYSGTLFSFKKDKTQ